MFTVPIGDWARRLPPIANTVAIESKAWRRERSARRHVPRRAFMKDCFNMISYPLG
jgi:hypothetical protein